MGSPEMYPVALTEGNDSGHVTPQKLNKLWVNVNPLDGQLADNFAPSYFLGFART